MENELREIDMELRQLDREIAATLRTAVALVAQLRDVALRAVQFNMVLMQQRTMAIDSPAARRARPTHWRQPSDSMVIHALELAQTGINNEAISAQTGVSPGQCLRIRGCSRFLRQPVRLLINEWLSKHPRADLRTLRQRHRAVTQ
jgi:hypothetical protein